MISGIAGKFAPLAVPLGLLAAAWVFLGAIGRIPPALLPVVQYSSYAVFFAGLVLSYWFNRSRVFFVILVLAAVQLTLAGPARYIRPPVFYSPPTFSLF